jgi:hypothetical protein
MKDFNKKEEVENTQMSDLEMLNIYGGLAEEDRKARLSDHIWPV